MRKFLIAVLLMLSLFVMSFAGCKTTTDDDSNPSVSQTDDSGDIDTDSATDIDTDSSTDSSSDEIAAESITLNHTSATLTEGDTLTLIATILPENATETDIVWESSNIEVATVENGVVLAKTQGAVTITAKAGKVSANCEIEVEAAPFISDEVNVDGYIWHETFKTVQNVPNYLKYTTSGGGSATLYKDNDGAQYLNLATNGTGSAFADYAFESGVLHGKVVAETRVQITTDSGAFHNMFFLYTADDKPVLTLGMDMGYFVTHNGTKWTKTSKSYNANEWYEVRLVIDFENKTYLLEINGELIDDALTFRTPSLSDQVSYMRMGADKQNSGILYDYVKLSYAKAPTITINNAQADINLDGETADEGEFTFDYTVKSEYTQTPTVSVTCSEQSGYTWVEESKKVKFVSAGTYVFTITLSDMAGSVSDEITVTVTGSYAAPEITLNSEETATLSLTENDTYTFDYAVSGSPVPTCVLTGTKGDFIVFDDETQIGLTYNEETKTIKFFAAGVYTFTLTAKNSQGETTKTITITVEDKYKTPDNITDESKIYYEEFGQLPEDANTTTSGTGSLTVEGGQIRFAIGTTSGAAFFQKKFKEELAGVVAVEMSFCYNHEVENSSFSNLMFLTNDDGTTNVTNFAVEYGYLKYRTSSTNWMAVRYCGYAVRLVKGAWYNLRVVNDFNSKVSYLYLSGESVDLYLDDAYVAPQSLGGEIYLDEYAFRNPQLAATSFRTGSEKTQANFAIDYVHIYSLSPVLNVAESSKTINDFKTSASYTLAYDCGEEVTVTCDKTEGFELNGNEVTFTESGLYVFTLTATNAYGKTIKTITVDVVDSIVKETEDILSVDFKNAETRPELPSGTGSATATYTENGLNMTTSSSESGTMYYQTTFAKALSGIVTTDITFSVGLNNKQFINLFFLYNSAFSGNPVANVAVSSTNGGINTYIQYRGGTVNSWKNQSYNGKTIELIKGDENIYTLRVLCDFDAKQLYIYLFGSPILLGGEQSTLPEEGIYIGSYGFRTPGTNAEGFRCGIDKKGSIDFTLASIKMYRSNTPVFATEPDSEELTLAVGQAETTLSYILLNGNAVVGCEQDGVTIDGNKITFTAAGEYTLTITATNDILDTKVIKTVKIIVREQSAE